MSTLCLYATAIIHHQRRATFTPTKSYRQPQTKPHHYLPNLSLSENNNLPQFTTLPLHLANLLLRASSLQNKSRRPPSSPPPTSVSLHSSARFSLSPRLHSNPPHGALSLLPPAALSLPGTARVVHLAAPYVAQDRRRYCSDSLLPLPRGRREEGV